MKISKLMIPLIGLTNVSNNLIEKTNYQISQAEVIQLESKVDLNINEILVKNDLDNAYNDIIQNNIAVLPNAQKNSVGKPTQVTTSEECMQIYQAALAACVATGPFYWACIAAAQVALLALPSECQLADNNFLYD